MYKVRKCEFLKQEESFAMISISPLSQLEIKNNWFFSLHILI